MLATGTIDPIARTFDILGVDETATSVTIINGNIRLAYTSPEGLLVQLVKPLGEDDGIMIGDLVGSSPATDSGVAGYAHKTEKKPFAKALSLVDWDDTSNLTYKSFSDANGVTRHAVLLPVVMG